MASDSARLKKRRKQLFLLLALVPVLAALALGWWPLALLVLVLLYLLNEVLWADHIFYDPAADFNYRIAAEPVAHEWHGRAVCLSEPGGDADTFLFETQVVAGLLGRVFDPWVEIESGGQTRRQVFERGVAARRTINLSAFSAELAAGKAVSLRAYRCKLDSNDSSLWAFNNGAVAERRPLIIAPHADDAEIAAFGLYSQAKDSTIVTLTAGETEVDQFMPWMEAGETALQASQFKGEVRSLDSVAAAIWGGLPQENCINLGYGCLQLEAMAREPDKAVASPYSSLSDSRPYRRFNRMVLPTDTDGATSWDNLLVDLVCILERCQPELIVTPHPGLDTHSDHIQATRAIWQALQRVDGVDPGWLLYANHLDASQDYPFGPAGGEIGLPPAVRDEIAVSGVYSLPLDARTRRNKALALDLMHDLKRPVRWKKWLRGRLQRWFIGRPLNPYGEDPFFRKAVRGSEIFFVAGCEQMATLVDGEVL